MAPERQRKPASERGTPEREPRARGRGQRRKDLRSVDDSFEIAPSGITHGEDPQRSSDGFRSPPRDDRAG